MKLALSFFLIVFSLVEIVISSVTLKDLYQEEWESFKAEYNKTYANQFEEKFRMKVYLENRQIIAQHNNLNSSYKLAMNRFGDLLSHERNKMMNGFRPDVMNLTEGQGATFLPPENLLTLPSYVDWREHGYVTPVKDQGDCGSCWAFAVTGALEGQTIRKYFFLENLSEQDLLDCSTHNFGCDGGNIAVTFLDIRDQKGIGSEANYPYEGVQKKCRYDATKRAASDVGFVRIKPKDEEALKIAVATVGPIAVSIDASKTGFAYYKEGIYTDNNCTPYLLDHAVLIVGYGTENGQDFWLVKNSWGVKWGDKGYIKVARNNNNQCGIATDASFPLVAPWR